MDPITQGALGASAGQLIKKHHSTAAVSLMAALAGMSADLDVLIRSETDPLLFLQYHRHFTHSFFFIPFGALLCALFLHEFIGKRNQFAFKESYLFCFAGYATHALLDACTTYGTLLFWPFSNERIAWNNIAVVDLFYTLPILFGLYLGIKKQSPWPARILVLWILLYPAYGFLQKNKAEEAAKLFLQAQHQPVPYDLSAKPSLGSLVLWKIVYESEGYFHVDAVHVGLFENVSDAMYYPGDKILKLDLSRDFPWLDKHSQQAKDVERFSWFSAGYVAKDDGALTGLSNRVIDIRYSSVPNEINPLWSIGLKPEASFYEHASYDNHRDTSKAAREKFMKMLFGKPLND